MEAAGESDLVRRAELFRCLRRTNPYYFRGMEAERLLVPSDISDTQLKGEKMPEHNVKVVDSKGHSFTIRIRTVRAGAAKWRVLDNGFIRYTEGWISGQRRAGTVFHNDKFLLGPNNTWGIAIYDWEDFWSENDAGTGYVVQPWVLALEPGTITWERWMVPNW